MKDRSYYRMEQTRDLIEEAKHYPNDELCIVLGERAEAMAKLLRFALTKKKTEEEMPNG